MKQICLLLIFYFVFGEVSMAQKQMPKGFQLLTHTNKNHLSDVENYYTQYKIKNSVTQTINTFENYLETLSTKDDIVAIVKILDLMSNEYRLMIAKDKNYINHLNKLFLGLIKATPNICMQGELYTLLGMLYTDENIKDYHTARTYFEKHIELGRQAPCRDSERNTIFPYIIISKHIYEKIGDYAKALHYYIYAVQLSDSLNLSFEKKAYYQDRLARFYYKTENYAEAYQAWEKVLTNLQRGHIKNRDLIQTFNNLGLAKRKVKMLDKAAQWFDKALAEAVNQKDTIWEGIISGNLGYNAFLAENYSKAISLLEKDIRICLYYKEYSNLISSLVYMGLAYQAQKNYNKALKYYEEAEKYLEKERTSVLRYDPQADMRLYADIYKGFSEISDVLGNYDSAYLYLKLHKRYSDTLTFLQHKENLALQQAQQAFNTKSKESELAIKNQGFLIIFLLLLLSLVVVVGLLFFRNNVLANKEKQLKSKNLELANEAERERNQRLQEAIVIKEQEIAIAALRMQQKNEMLLELKKGILEPEHTNKKLEKMVDYTIDLDDNWEIFKKHFEQIHPLFFHKLAQISDKITPNDCKHCAYICINLDTKQVAHLMRIAPESVKMSRNRLRKKLQLAPEVDLYKFLISL